MSHAPPFGATWPKWWRNCTLDVPADAQPAVPGRVGVWRTRCGSRRWAWWCRRWGGLSASPVRVGLGLAVQTTRRHAAAATGAALPVVAVRIDLPTSGAELGVLAGAAALAVVVLAERDGRCASAAPTVAMPRAAAATASVFLIDHEVRANGTAPADTGTAGTGDTVDPAGTAGVASDGTGTACIGSTAARARRRGLPRRAAAPPQGRRPRAGPALGPRAALPARRPPTRDVLGLVSRCAGRSGFGHGGAPREETKS